MKDNFNHRSYVRCDISNRLQARKGSDVQESGVAKAGDRERERERERERGKCMQEEREQ